MCEFPSQCMYYIKIPTLYTQISSELLVIVEQTYVCLLCLFVRLMSLCVAFDAN